MRVLALISTIVASICCGTLLGTAGFVRGQPEVEPKDPTEVEPKDPKPSKLESVRRQLRNIADSENGKDMTIALSEFVAEEFRVKRLLPYSGQFPLSDGYVLVVEGQEAGWHFVLLRYRKDLPQVHMRLEAGRVYVIDNKGDIDGDALPHKWAIFSGVNLTAAINIDNQSIHIAHARGGLGESEERDVSAWYQAQSDIAVLNQQLKELVQSGQATQEVGDKKK